MASSNASVRPPARDPSYENIVPLESVVTDEPSGSGNLAGHNATPDIPSQPLGQWDEILNSQRAVLKRLKAWHQWEIDRYKSLGKFLVSKAGFPKRPIRPSNDQLLSLATHFFPPRWSLKVIVCDFGDGRFERCEIELINVKKCKSLSCFWCDDLTLIYCVRLGKKTNVGDCTVDVCFPNSNALDSIDVRRHIPIGSGSLESVRP